MKIIIDFDEWWIPVGYRKLDSKSAHAVVAEVDRSWWKEYKKVKQDFEEMTRKK